MLIVIDKGKDGATMAIAIEAQISLLNFYHSKNGTTVRSVQEIPI